MWRNVLKFRMLVCLLWVLGTLAGFATLIKYQSTQGATGVSPQKWPEGAAVALNSHHDTLVMFVHPQCPCSKASIEELNRLLAQSHGNLSTHVFFVRPHGYSDDWAKTELWRSTAAIPNVSVHEDIDGAQARLFGAETSGHVLLYDTRARLLFSGGITGSRGHEGDNAGEEAIVSLASGETTGVTNTQVYGCSLLGFCKAPPKGQP